MPYLRYAFSDAQATALRHSRHSKVVQMAAAKGSSEGRNDACRACFMRGILHSEGVPCKQRVTR